MQYKVLKSGRADAVSPKLGTECACHYTGTRMDGFGFDSSKKRGKPACFAPKNVIRGWTIAMQLMGVGDKWQLWIPSEHAYGDAGRRDEKRGQYIPPGAVLVFELELLEVNGPSKPRPKRPADMPSAPNPTADDAIVDVSSDVARQAEPTAESSPAVAPLAAPDEKPLKGSPKVAPALTAEGAFDDGVDATLEAVSTLLGKLELTTLQRALADLGLPTDGGKRELSERITGALQAV